MGNYLASPKALLWAGIVPLIGMLPTVARAQAADTGEETSAPGEIVVTAQRRVERLIDVPSSVSVVTAEALEGSSITNTRDLAQVTSGLQISNTGVFTAFSVRGISSETSGPGAENNVAIYVDGVYYPSKSSGVFDFPDVASIEVLKGPQGTLYGRNATGGAILFKTIDPTFEPSGKFSASYGSFEEREIKGTFSTGIVPDLLAASVSGFYKKDDGYLRSSITGKRMGDVEAALIRGKLLLTPSPDIKVVLSAYYADRTDRQTLAFTNFNGNTVGVNAGANVITSTYGFSAANNPNLLTNKTLGIDLRADFETGIGDLTLVSGYTDIRNRALTDGDNSSATITDFLTVFPQSSFSQEVYLTSRKFGALSFVIGANYYRDSGRFDPSRVFSRGVVIADIYSKVKTEAFAAYIDSDLDISDRLTATAGLRWTTERKEMFGGFSRPDLPFFAARRWNNLSPRAALRYAIGDDANIYVNYSRGFKSGQFNPSAFGFVSEVRPEIVDAFEGGFKARLAGQWTIDLSAFRYDYKDIQVTAFVNGTSVLQNAAIAEIYGLDAKVVYQPDDDLTITASVSPLHAQYKSFPSATITVPTPTSACPAGRTFCGNRNGTANLSGFWLPRAPKVTANASISYTLRTGEQAINFYANAFYSGKFFWEPSNRLGQDGYVLLNGRVSWRINDGPLSIEVWGKNLTDKKYYISQAIGTSGDGLLSARPRSWGVTGRASF